MLSCHVLLLSHFCDFVDLRLRSHGIHCSIKLALMENMLAVGGKVDYVEGLCLGLDGKHVGRWGQS